MGELTNIVNMRAGRLGLHLHKTPAGTYSFVGTVPMELCFVDPTPEKIANLQFGERFGPKRRTFATPEDAKAAADALGHEANYHDYLQKLHDQKVDRPRSCPDDHPRHRFCNQ